MAQKRELSAEELLRRAEAAHTKYTPKEEEFDAVGTYPTDEATIKNYREGTNEDPRPDIKVTLN